MRGIRRVYGISALVADTFVRNVAAALSTTICNTDNLTFHANRFARRSLNRSPFQPGSTPITFDAETAQPLPRLLQWNHIGALTSTPSGRQTSYDVTFNNSGLRRGHTFSRAESFIVGAVGEDGCIMATDVEDEMVRTF